MTPFTPFLLPSQQVPDAQDAGVSRGPPLQVSALPNAWGGQAVFEEQGLSPTLLCHQGELMHHCRHRPHLTHTVFDGTGIAQMATSVCWTR